MHQHSVKACRSTKVVTIGADATLPEASRFMKEVGFRCLPALSDDRLVGILSLSDIHEAEPADATSLNVWDLIDLLSKLGVEKIMISHPLTLHKSATLGEAARLMLKKKVGGIPVVDSQDRLVGIITDSNVFRAVVTEWHRT